MLIDRINNGGERLRHSPVRGSPLSPVHRRRYAFNPEES
jgi:hypothetical protein